MHLRESRVEDVKGIKCKYQCLSAVAQLVEALRYKPEGRGFDPL